MNALIRFKLALTEPAPDTSLPVNISLSLLTALHKKWVVIIKFMSDEDWKKIICHPEHKRETTLWDLIGTYAWHGNHHTAQILKLRERQGR